MCLAERVDDFVDCGLRAAIGVGAPEAGVERADVGASVVHRVPDDLIRSVLRAVGELETKRVEAGLNAEPFEQAFHVENPLAEQRPADPDGVFGAIMIDRGADVTHGGGEDQRL